MRPCRLQFLSSLSTDFYPPLTVGASGFVPLVPSVIFAFNLENTMLCGIGGAILGELYPD